MTIVKETSPTTFAVEQNLDTMNFARTNAFDSKTGHLFVMAEERGPAPPTPPGWTRGARRGDTGDVYDPDDWKVTRAV